MSVQILNTNNSIQVLETCRRTTASVKLPGFKQPVKFPFTTFRNVIANLTKGEEGIPTPRVSILYLSSAKLTDASSILAACQDGSRKIEREDVHNTDIIQYIPHTSPGGKCIHYIQFAIMQNV